MIGLKPAWALLALPVCWLAACGETSSDSGGAGESGGSAAEPATGGSAAAETGGGAPETGGSSGAAASGAQAGTGGSSGSAGAPAGGSGGIDCSLVGCAAPPLCSEGCQAECGCCPCGEGQINTVDGVDYVCTNGCWDVPGRECYAPDGRAVPVGSSIHAGDGCNTCTCRADGSLDCSQTECVCDPAAEENQREYVGTSPDMCAVIDFACPDNTTYFGNDCGCGCEQSLDCPEWFDCMPTMDDPGPCNEDEIRSECPYSMILY